jgi:hypothetical protein
MEFWPAGFLFRLKQVAQVASASGATLLPDLVRVQCDGSSGLTSTFT